MIEIANDPMWGEFQPLWLKLQEAGRGLLVAGGYGLFLKQHSLISEPERTALIRFEDWRDSTPRVTKDLDLVIDLELLASDKAQQLMAAAMGQCGFNVVAKNPRWQFEKTLGTDRVMIVDLHSELPDSDSANLTLDKIRVKHRPSLGDAGVHGRQNPQAAGCNHYPYHFKIGGVDIGVPNPVTWSMMKLIAMRDRLRKSEEHDGDEAARNFQREQAMKHARDVARVVAMTTRGERDHATEVVTAIQARPTFADAKQTRQQFFEHDDSWGTQVVRGIWRSEDLGVIREMLATWFG